MKDLFKKICFHLISFSQLEIYRLNKFGQYIVKRYNFDLFRVFIIILMYLYELVFMAFGCNLANMEYIKEYRV